MSLTGAPDYQQQQAPTVTAFPLINVNTSGTQTVDISANFFPHHQTLLIYWVAALTSVGSGINIAIDAPNINVRLQFPTTIADGGYTRVVVPGQIVVGALAGGCTISVSVVPGSATPVQGTLAIFALTETLETHNGWHLPTIGNARGAFLSTNAGGTNTPLPAPVAGRYFRIKNLQLRVPIGPAATNIINYQYATSLEFFMGIQIPAGFVGTLNHPLDLIVTDGVKCVNSTTVLVTSYIAYEEYPI